MSSTLEALNKSVSDISREELVRVANNYVATPGYIILYLGMMLVFLCVGLIFVERSRGNFMKIWLLSGALGLFILLFLALLPLFVNSVVEGIINLFS